MNNGKSIRFVINNMFKYLTVHTVFAFILVDNCYIEYVTKINAMYNTECMILDNFNNSLEV